MQLINKSFRSVFWCCWTFHETTMYKKGRFLSNMIQAHIYCGMSQGLEIPCVREPSLSSIITHSSWKILGYFVFLHSWAWLCKGKRENQNLSVIQSENANEVKFLTGLWDFPREISTASRLLPVPFGGWGLSVEGKAGSASPLLLPWDHWLAGHLNSSKGLLRAVGILSSGDWGHTRQSKRSSFRGWNSRPASLSCLRVRTRHPKWGRREVPWGEGMLEASCLLLVWWLHPCECSRATWEETSLTQSLPSLTT